MARALFRYATIAALLFPAFAASVSAEEAPPERPGTSAPAQDAAQKRRLERSPEKDAEANRHTAKPVQDAAEPEHLRGQVTAVQASSMVMKTGEGKTVRIGITEETPIFSLSKGSFTEVDFGVYVGAAAVRLDQYSPIIRDSAVWLHKGFELRIIDEQLRGIALGEKKWDLTPDSVIAHGWVDDIEVRVLSIKWGPTDYDETDVEIPRDAPVIRMSLGDRSLIRPGAQVFAGAQKGEDGKYAAVFVFVGKDGIVPPL